MKALMYEIDLARITRKFVNRSKRLERFIKLDAPQIIINNERRMLLNAAKEFVAYEETHEPVENKEILH